MLSVCLLRAFRLIPRIGPTRNELSMKLSVIIPVYNEEKTVLEVIERVRNCGVNDLQIIIVNDCSTDGTKAELEKLPQAEDLVIVHHEVNKGKGAAIRTAQEHVAGEVMVIQDADMEYSPTEFPAMLRLIEEDLADAVFGSRYSGREILVDGFWHYVANKFLTTLSNMLSNIHLTDMETCYKMIRADIFKDLELECNRFGIEPELTAKLARRRCRIYEAPISYVARRFDEGKKIGWKDGVAAIRFIFEYNLWNRESVKAQVVGGPRKPKLTAGEVSPTAEQGAPKEEPGGKAASSRKRGDTAKSSPAARKRATTKTKSASGAKAKSKAKAVPGAKIKAKSKTKEKAKPRRESARAAKKKS